MLDAASTGNVVFRQTKKTELANESMPFKEPDNDSSDLPRRDAVHQYERPLSTSRCVGRNFWFILWVIPILFVLISLPVQEEYELEGMNRAVLAERVSVLASQPSDFVVHAASNQRWSYLPKKKPHHGGSGSASQSPCVRLTGLNQTLNDFPDLRKQLPRIKHIRIVGERNSGTRTLHVDLEKSLRNVTVEGGVTRWGYWFQDPALLSRSEISPEETLVIHVVVEPYEWFARMQVNPIHAPHHRKPETTSANWTAQTFMKRPWTMPRPEWDKPEPEQGHCQYRFPIGGVVPCISGKNTGIKSNKNFPVYEMHPTKMTPFPTIIHLRTAKLKNFFNISTWMPHVIHVRARDVGGLPGFNKFVSALLDRYRLSAACQVNKRDMVKGSSGQFDKSGEAKSWADNPPEPLTNWQSRFVTCNLDWSVERQVGFHPKDADLSVVCPHGFVGSKAHTSQDGADDRGILFRFMDGISTNFGRRRRATPTDSPKRKTLPKIR